MNVLFVSETRFSRAPYRDGSTRYRCYHMAEALHAAGHLADVTTLDAVHLVNLSRYDVVSVQQPTASRKLTNVLEQCAKLQIKTVADLDAYEFDPELAAESPKSPTRNGGVAEVRAGFMHRSLILQQFDEVSVATEELARARRALAPHQPVYVAQNGLSNYWLSCNDQITLSSPVTQRVGYFSDIRNQSVEFAPAVSAVREFLQASRNHELYVVGPLLIPDQQIPESQLTRGAWIDFIDLPKALSQCWANLAPHQATRINYAQPHTKFIEAAAFGVPTIASPSAELLSHDVPGLFIVDTDEQWIAAFEALGDQSYRRSCQQALYDYARDCCLASHSVENLIRQWSANHEKPNDETITRLSAAS